MDLPVGNEGSLNGVTAVTAVAAPAAGKQRVVMANGVAIHNLDTVAHTFTFQKNKNSTLYVLQVDATVAAGAVATLAKPVVLDATDESLEVVDDAGATTTEPTFDAAFMETD